MTRVRSLILLAALIPAAASASGVAAAAPKVTPNSINAAAPNDKNDDDTSLIIKAEVLLDREHFSPGEIDGKNGDNYRKALRAFQQVRNIPVTDNLDPDTWSALTANVSQPVLKIYTISKADVAGPFDKRIPARLVQLAKLPGLSYKSPLEEFAEKFHMSQGLLQGLNPHAEFGHAGTRLVVADVEPLDLRGDRHTVEAVQPKTEKTETGGAATIVVDKATRDVRAYDKEGKLLAFYPATIGSKEKPAPTGIFAVKGVAWNPDYHYDPKFAWKAVNTKRKLTVQPGPNNPVGLVWIDLTAPSYGIHGTPQPENIGKTESHGCIRLTNWDALDLAVRVRHGTVVKFVNEDLPVVPLSSGGT